MPKTKTQTQTQPKQGDLAICGYCLRGISFSNPNSWLHVESGNAYCAPPRMPRAKPGTPKTKLAFEHTLMAVIADGLDGSTDGRGFGGKHEEAFRLANAAPAMREAIEEAEVAFACINVCDGLTPQARGALKTAWAKVQAAKLQVRSPDSVTAEAINSGGTALSLVLADRLRERFPWLGTEDAAGSGADLVTEVATLYDELRGNVHEEAAEPPATLCCPECGYEQDDEQGFRYLEAQTTWREVGEYKPEAAVLTVHGYYQVYDEDLATNIRLECRACFSEFPIPKGVEVDFV